MLNYETLLSSYDDKLTLMQWLKKVEAALKDASAVSFNVNKKGDATLTFSIVFEDGSEIESGEIVLQQGESVESAAIVNGHLILTLTNGDELDAGQLLNGDLNVSGNLAATGKITGGEIVEDMNMAAYPYHLTIKQDYITPLYISAVKNGNKLSFVITAKLNIAEGQTFSDYTELLRVSIGVPVSVRNAIVPLVGSRLDQKTISLFSNSFLDVFDLRTNVSTDGQNIDFSIFGTNAANTGITRGRDYAFRYELTFLLGDNLAA